MNHPSGFMSVLTTAFTYAEYFWIALKALWNFVSEMNQEPRKTYKITYVELDGVTSERLDDCARGVNVYVTLDIENGARIVKKKSG